MQYWMPEKEAVVEKEELPEAEINEIIKKCQSIQNNLERGKCWWNVRLTAKDEKVCEIIPEPEYLDTKYACYYEVALFSKDINLCEKSGHLKRSCKARVYEIITTYSEEEAKKIIENRTTEAILAIKNKDTKKLSNLVYPDKGVRFSPYAYVDIEKDLILPRENVLNFFEDQTVYSWGTYDGIGTLINLAPKEYHNKFIYDADFVNAKEISYNRTIGSGNTINNAFEVYLNTIIVEYHFPGFDPTFEGMDWRSLRLVFEKKGNAWYLIGMIHDQWTI